MQPEDIEQIADVIERQLERFAAAHAFGQQLLYTRAQAASVLGISLSSVQVLIARGEIRTRHFGAKVLISHEELLRVSKKDFTSIWPEHDAEGKTRRSIG